MVYSREESFFGHVHRHPARCATSTAAPRTGGWSTSRPEIVLDGGAYASSSPAVAANAAPRHRPVRGAATCDGRNALYTNNPPCGAMRGFGAVQACFAYETQMDKLAAALGLDPVELRIRNAMREGSACRPGRGWTRAAPVAEI